MTTSSRNLHPSNGPRESSPSGPDVVVPITAALKIPQQAAGGSTETASTTTGLHDFAIDDTDDDNEIFPTELQWEILEMLSKGCDDDLIAHRLNLQMCTYYAAVSALATTLGACNRFQLALKAREQGWV